MLISMIIVNFLVGLYHNNPTYGSCKAQEWNPRGNSLFYEDFTFPIFIVTNKTEIDYLIHSVCIILPILVMF